MPENPAARARIDEATKAKAAAGLATMEPPVSARNSALGTYYPSMDTMPLRTEPPAGWPEALARSEAELAAGIPTVPAEVVHQRVRDAIARIEARKQTRVTADVG